MATRTLSLRAKTYSRLPLPDNARVHLTKDESNLCTLLDDCATWLKKEKGLDVTCRIAGGWVRDKLLGSASSDIDIALDTMMGMPFAELLVEFCSSVGMAGMDKIAKIESNPDRSKHLETARTNVLGFDLDLVNLRSEEYAENSRIPTQIAFGTPLQDALRRDITINTMFYNVHSRTVEDFTDKGLTDLREGIVRTPLPPKVTFLDDPLRVLRCLRFASRFGFELETTLLGSLRDPEIQDAIRNKISRERVGEEIDKTMKGRDPLRAIRLITDLSLYDPIFHIPASVTTEVSTKPAPPHVAYAAAALLHTLAESTAPNSLPPIHPIMRDAVKDNGSRARLYLGCALWPYHGITYQDRKKKTLPAVDAAIREGLKLGTQNHYLDGIPALFAGARLVKESGIESHMGSSSERVSIGLVLRDKCINNPYTGSAWPASLLFSLVCELVPFWDHAADVLDEPGAAERINVYNKFIKRALELNLHTAIEAKPILDGHEIVRVLDVARSGPWMTDIVHRVSVWQLDHPEGSKQDCEAWLRAELVSGAIQISSAPSSGGRQDKPKVKRGNATHSPSNLKKPKTEDIL